jgi:hypothetical protein
VAITEAMTRDGLLTREAGFALTGRGVRWLTATLGAELPAARSRRPMVRGCLDWTERREHLAGTAGAHLCHTLLDRDWITRIGSGRAIRVTPAGTDGLRRLFGPDPAWH